MGPVPGWPLRPNTTYAAVVTTAVAQPHPLFRRQLLSADTDVSHLAHLAREWTRLGRSPDEIAIASTFTTRDPTAEMGAIAQWISDHLERPDLSYHRAP